MVPEAHARRPNAPAVPHLERVRRLVAVPVFSHLPEDVIERLADELGEAQFRAGEAIINEGETGDRMYVILSGRAEVSAKVRGEPSVLAVLERGETFGELALLTPNKQRLATVKALKPVTALVLTDASFSAALATVPEARSLLAAAADEMATVRFLKLASPFRRLTPEEVRWLARRLTREKAAAGAVILAQGDSGDSAYLLRSGRVEVVVADGKGGETRLSVLEAGTLFGEAALLTEEDRNATVRAVEPCELMRLKRSDLAEAMKMDRAAGAGLFEFLRLRDKPRQVEGVTVRRLKNPEGEEITVLRNADGVRYFRLSPSGWFLWQRLDGTRSLRDLSLAYYDEYKRFEPERITELITGLADAGFLVARKVHPELLAAEGEGAKRLTARARRALEWRKTFRNVDAKIEAVYRRVLWPLFTPAGVMVLGAIAVMGLGVFAGNIGRYGAHHPHDAFRGMLWAFLYPATLTAMAFHEAGHAFATKHFGYRVGGVGLGFYWLNPILFIDNSDMWLAGRRARVLTTVAGPFTNLVIAGIAAISCHFVEDRIWGVYLWQFAFVSYLMVLSNLNPLLEYDGYYILMDVLERPNLRADCLRWLSRELPAALREPRKLLERRMELLFGLGTLLYVVLMCTLVLFLYRLMVAERVKQLGSIVFSEVFGWLTSVAIFIGAAVRATEEARR